MSSNQLRLLLVTPPWMKSPSVKCGGLTAFFYPNQPSSEVAQAKAVCNGLDGRGRCPLRSSCLRHAIDQRESYGVWGGTSERDRRKIQRARNKFKNLYIYDMEDVRFPGVLFVSRRVVRTIERRSVQEVSPPVSILVRRRVVRSAPPVGAMERLAIGVG